MLCHVSPDFPLNRRIWKAITCLLQFTLCVILPLMLAIVTAQNAMASSGADALEGRGKSAIGEADRVEWNPPAVAQAREVPLIVAQGSGNGRNFVGKSDFKGELKYLGDLGGGLSEWEYKGTRFKFYGLGRDGRLLEDVGVELERGGEVYLAAGDDDGGLEPLEGVYLDRARDELVRVGSSGVSARGEAVRGFKEGFSGMMSSGKRGLSEFLDFVGGDGSGLRASADESDKEVERDRGVGQVLQDLRSAHGHSSVGSSQREGWRLLGWIAMFALIFVLGIILIGIILFGIGICAIAVNAAREILRKNGRM